LDVVVPQLQHRNKYSIQSWKSQPPTNTILQIPYSLDTDSPFKVPQLGCAVSSLVQWTSLGGLTTTHLYVFYSYVFSPFLSFLTLSPLLPYSPTPTKTYLLFCPQLNSSHFNYFLIILYRYFLLFPFCELRRLPQIFHQHSPLPRPQSTSMLK